jgi:hypothetical protein
MSVLWGSLMQRGWLLQEVSDSMTALQQLARLLHLKAEGGNADLARVRRLLRRWGVLYDSLRQQLQVQGGGSGQGCGGIRAETAVQRLQALQKLMGVPEVLAQFGSSEEVGGITQGIAAAVAEFEGMLHCQHHAAVPAVGPVSASERQHQWAAVLEGGFVQAGVAAAAGDSGGGGGDDAERQAVLALASLAGLK